MHSHTPSYLRDQRPSRLPLPPADTAPIVRLEHLARDERNLPWLLALVVLGAILGVLGFLFARGAR